MKLPQQFLNNIKHAKGYDEKALIAVHEDPVKITSVRLNPFKPFEPDFTLGEKVRWCDNAFYLDERPAFTFDPLFHAGCYYVQEAGSMFLQQVLNHCCQLKDDLTVLDLCAAPGGKSTLINSLITKNSVLISNEVIKQRAEILSQNLSKWGNCNVAVTNSDPSAFGKLPEVFDVIVADVPCSGSGLFRKQPEAVNEWSENNVQLCCTRQKRILGDVLTSLKTNGLLIYSTCSYSEEENEKIVEWLMKEFSMELIKVPLQNDWKIIDTGSGYRFYPYLTKSEGFFCAVLKKTNEQEEAINKYKPKNNALEKPNNKELNNLLPYLTNTENKNIVKFKNEFKLMSSALYKFFELYGSDLYFKKAGTVLGEIKQNDFLPDHELAQSIYLNENVAKIALSREQALTFLKKENLVLNNEKGIYLITYKGYGLGWAKVLDRRLNNYLPKNYRILTSEEN